MCELNPQNASTEFATSAASRMQALGLRKELQEELKSRGATLKVRRAEVDSVAAEEVPRAKHELSLYAHISKIAWRYEGTCSVCTVNVTRRRSVRKPGADTAALVASVVACEPGAQEPWPWSDDAYLQPVLADDPLLYTLSMDDEEQDEAEERADMLEAVSTRGAAHLSPAPAVGPG